MIKTITQNWLKENGACPEAANDWHNEEDHGTIETLNRLINKNPDWANWLIVRVMTRKQYITYAVFAAEQVIDIYEKKYPEDKRPRQAIQAAKLCLKNNNVKNINAAAYAAGAAYEAAYAAEAAFAAAYAAAYAAGAAYAAAYAAAYEAAYAAAYAAGAAYEAAFAAGAAYEAAYAAAYEATDKKKMQIKILKYGMKLLKENN